MRNIVVSGILLLGPTLGLIADDGAFIQAPPKVIPINAGIEHSFKFGLLNLGYERIKTDCVYTGVETKIASILNMEDSKNKTLDHYINGEVRIGYNLGMGDLDVITPYGGVGFSVFSIEKAEGKLKNWNYGALGVKYMHKFGEIFEMGLHIKGAMSISQKEYQTFSAPSKKEKSIKFEGTGTVGADRTMAHTGDKDIRKPATTTFDNDDGKDHLTAVKVTDSRWVTEIGLPMVWHLGDEKKWEIHCEPYYAQIPNRNLTHVVGSRLALGYRY